MLRAGLELISKSASWHQSGLENGWLPVATLRWHHIFTFQTRLILTILAMEWWIHHTSMSLSFTYTHIRTMLVSLYLAKRQFGKQHPIMLFGQGFVMFTLKKCCCFLYW